MVIAELKGNESKFTPKLKGQLPTPNQVAFTPI